MPIYAYRCARCGFAKDVLQKISDAPLITCPQCGEAAFEKQITAASFQLKGSGWYATDFRNNNAPATKTDTAETTGASSEKTASADNAAAGTQNNTSAPAKSDSADSGSAAASKVE